MNTIPYFIGDIERIIADNNESQKQLISFAETEEERQEMQKEIDRNKERIEADQKVYLILFAGYFGDSEEVDYQQWDYAKGRQNAYDIIKETFLSVDLREKNITLDAYQSRIIVETNSGKMKLTGISIYKFVSTMIREGKIIDDDGTFDIEEWAEDTRNNDD